MNWIRQDHGNGLESIGEGFTDTSSNDYTGSVKGCIEISKDIIDGMVYLRLFTLLCIHIPNTLVEESREAFLKFHRIFVHLDKKVAAEHTKSDVSV